MRGGYRVGSIVEGGEKGFCEEQRGVAYVALGSSPDVARMLHAEDAGGGAVEVGQQDGFGVFQEALPGAAVIFGSQRVGAEGETFEPGVDLGVEVEG